MPDALSLLHAYEPTPPTAPRPAPRLSGKHSGSPRPRTAGSSRTRGSHATSPARQHHGSGPTRSPTTVTTHRLAPTAPTSSPQQPASGATFDLRPKRGGLFGPWLPSATLAHDERTAQAVALKTCEHELEMARLMIIKLQNYIEPLKQRLFEAQTQRSIESNLYEERVLELEDALKRAHQEHEAASVAQTVTYEQTLAERDAELDALQDQLEQAQIEAWGTTRVQQFGRGLTARRHLEASRAAAMRIQAYARGRSARCNLVAARDASKRVQAATRRHAAQSEYAAKRAAAQRVQRAGRGSNVRRRLEDQTIAARKVQRAARARRARLRAARLERDSILGPRAQTIQALFSGIL